jgi:hypothetical protein
MKKSTLLSGALIALCFWGSQAFAQDASLTNLGVAPYVQLNTNYTLTVNMINNSGPAINSFTVSWQLDGGAVYPYTSGIGGGGLPSTGGYYLPLTLSPALNISVAGVHTLKVWVDVDGDTNTGNDTTTVSVTALTAFANKVVLLEEATAQWCPHCPPAGVVTDSLSPQPDIIVQRFHNTDNYSFDDGQTYFNRYYGAGGGFWPAGMVEMTEMADYTVNDNYPNWPGDVAAREGISPLDLRATYTLDTTTRSLSITFTANFKYALTGSFSFNGFILENNIIDYQIQPDESTDSNFVHNDVVRAILGGVSGTPGIIPNTPVVNTDYTQTYTTTIDPSWNIHNLTFTGVVFNTASGNTDAINAVKVGEYAPSGIKPLQAAAPVQVYPNPFTNGITINLPANSNNVSVYIYSIDGKMVYSRNYAQPTGTTPLYVDLQNHNLAAGTYNVVVKTSTGYYGTKVIKD